MATESNLSATATHNFIVKHGDTAQAVLTFTDEEAAAIDLTGATILVQVKSKATDEEAVALLTTDIEENVVTLTGFDELPVGKYVYDIQVTQGFNVTTYLGGKITVLQDVTRA